MAEGEKTRLVLWSTELRAVHDRMRKALSITRKSLASGDRTQPAGRDLLLFCHGFCTALAAHHRGEDRELFPAIASAHPDLGEVLRKLEQDHSMIAELIESLQASMSSSESPQALESHLDGIAAIMESHFQYEERQLLAVLDDLALDADPQSVLGPL